MDFARKQLEKYGWTEGKGLGKHENGISDALKPKIKRSVTGVGHNAAQDFTEHWWTTLYNKAANNVEVEQENGKTKKIKTKDDNDFEITNSTWKLHRKAKNREEQGEYKNFFVKTAVLANGGSKVQKLRESDSEDEPEEKKDVLKMTDEELFAACGGRTAHKGARFGLKATGKLARIKQQEENLLNLDKYIGYSHAKKHQLKDTQQRASDEKIIKKHRNVEDSLSEENKSSEIIIKKRKNKNINNCETLNLYQDMCDIHINKEDLLSDNIVSKQKHDNDVETLAVQDVETAERVSKKYRRKKKKNLASDSSSDPIVESTNLEEEKVIKCKKKYKKHSKLNK